jgi:hypothetical protein
MHGSVNPDEEWESYVITEEDRLEFHARMRRPNQSAILNTFMDDFQNYQFHFHGYELKDCNMRALLRNPRMNYQTPATTLRGLPSHRPRIGRPPRGGHIT